jgi:pimeloyl-ACP methyl ester carboxylesterase
MSKPTYVLLPGAWHSPSIYDDVVNLLAKHDYPAISLPPPGGGGPPGCLSKLVSQDKEVILVVHSYAGLPGGEATKDLGKKDREAQGLKGGIIRFVVINGFVAPPGFQPAPRGDYSTMPEWMKFDAETDTFSVTPTDATNNFYHDLPVPLAASLAASLRPHSAGVFFSTTTHAAWMHIPSTYLISMEDRTRFTAALSEFTIQATRQMEPSAFDVVERCEGAGHCVMISEPEWTAEALRRAAGEVV